MELKDALLCLQQPAPRCRYRIWPPHVG